LPAPIDPNLSAVDLRRNSGHADNGQLRAGKENLHVAPLVGVAMCSASWCGSHNGGPYALLRVLGYCVAVRRSTMTSRFGLKPSNSPSRHVLTTAEFWWLVRSTRRVHGSPASDFSRDIAAAPQWLWRYRRGAVINLGGRLAPRPDHCYSITPEQIAARITFRRLPKISPAHLTLVGRVLFATSFANKQIGDWREDISHCVRPETWVTHQSHPGRALHIVPDTWVTPSGFLRSRSCGCRGKRVR
jgi:hypothetical protein